MPGYDRTGPRGQGPMTGGGFGYCGKGRGYRRLGFRRFAGRDAGYGRGYKRAYNYDSPTITVDEEKDMIKEEIEFLKARLDEIEKNQQE